MQSQPMIILGEDSQRMKDKDAQSHNISAARAVAESVKSTLGPKGMDKMLVSSIGDVTVTNDGVTILTEMDIDNPTAEMIVEVAETQEDEAGDGTTTAVAIAGELLKNAEDLLEQDIHPTSIIRGFHLGSERAREEVGNVAVEVDPEDEEILKSVAETSMTGKGAELNRDVLVDLVVRAVQSVTVEADDGSYITDLEFLDIETQTGRSVSESELLEGAVVDKDPVHEEMPTTVEDSMALAGFIQALVARLCQARRRDEDLRPLPRPEVLEVNRNRAQRHGTQAPFLRATDEGIELVPGAEAVADTIAWLDDVPGQLGVEQAIDRVETIVRSQATGADRQLAVREKGGSFEAVVDDIRARTVPEG